MAIKSVNEIPVYEEIDGEEKLLDDDGAPKVTVRSHPTRRDLVVLVVDGKKRVVASHDVQAAVQNATNV